MKNLTEFGQVAVKLDGWKFPALFRVDCDTYTDHSWPGCDYRTEPLTLTGIELGFNVTITGRKSHLIAFNRFKTRAKIEIVGDGEPSQFVSADIYSNQPIKEW